MRQPNDEGALLKYHYGVIPRGFHLNAKNRDRLSAVLFWVRDKALKVGAAGRRWRPLVDRDGVLIGILFGLALFLRLPFLSSPPVMLFDEVLYANFLVHEQGGHPLFDVHPPFARLLFGAIANNMPYSEYAVPVEIGIPHNDIPFRLLRTFVALAGSLLPVVLYFIARLVGYGRGGSFLAGSFAAFDSALVLYSRAILPDMLLVVMGFSALLFAIAATSTHHRIAKAVFVLLSGIFIGCALATKWTALGLLGAIVFFYVFRRHYYPIVATLIIAGVVYGGIFASEADKVRDAKLLDPGIPVLEHVVGTISIPSDSSAQSVARFITEYHYAAMRINRDPVIAERYYLQAPTPLSWANGQATLAFWGQETPLRKIILRGNSLLWLSAFLLFLFEASWIGAHLLRAGTTGVTRAEIFFLIAYLGNYLPFFLIDRPMYLYHYFSALCFLFLLAPPVAIRMISCIGLLSRDKLFASFIAWFVLLLIIVNGLFLFINIYGIPIDPNGVFLSFISRFGAPY